MEGKIGKSVCCILTAAGTHGMKNFIHDIKIQKVK